MDCKLLSFDELSVTQLYDLLQLRATVFVVEQNCAYLDPDDKDREALHLLGYSGDKLVAYSRLLPPGVAFEEASIGRVVVSPNHRRKDYGRLITRKAIEHALEKFNTNEIKISAQLYLLQFYGEFGFERESEVYLEDNIPHVKMRLSRPSK